MAKSMKKLTKIRSSGAQYMRQSAAAAVEMGRIHDRLIAAGFEHDGMDGYDGTLTADNQAEIEKAIALENREGVPIVDMAEVYYRAGCSHLLRTHGKPNTEEGSRHDT